MLNRRGFLSLAAAAITASFDPERALWVPGRKLISIPSRHAPGNINFDIADASWTASGGSIVPRFAVLYDNTDKDRVVVPAWNSPPFRVT